MNSVFLTKLKENNWIEVSDDWEYKKGNWRILRDTGSWWMIESSPNHRLFDFPEPTDSTAPWTVNLIEHLCILNEKIKG